MALIDKLTQQGSTLTKWDGATPPTPIDATQSSRLHNQYSINGDPLLQKKPSPSQLDLDGKTPPKYTDNLPG